MTVRGAGVATGSGCGLDPGQPVFQELTVGGSSVEPEDDPSGVTNHDRGDR